MNFITADTATPDSVEAALDAAFAAVSIPLATPRPERDFGRSGRIRAALRGGVAPKVVAFNEGVSASLVYNISRMMKARAAE